MYGRLLWVCRWNQKSVEEKPMSDVDSLDDNIGFMGMHRQPTQQRPFSTSTHGSGSRSVASGLPDIIILDGDDEQPLPLSTQGVTSGASFQANAYDCASSICLPSISTTDSSNSLLIVSYACTQRSFASSTTSPTPPCHSGIVSCP